MKGLTTCIMKATPDGEAGCYTAIMDMERRAAMALQYWTNVVESSGGKTGTKNLSEQAGLTNATNVLDGTRKGLNEIFPERFAEDGTMLATCVDMNGT